MKTGRDFTQAYNGQAAVDAESQVIVAQSLSNAATDVQQLAPIVKQIKPNTGRQARELSADAGYCYEGNLAILARSLVEKAFRDTARRIEHLRIEKSPSSV
jgi:hypothetical protein